MAGGQENLNGRLGSLYAYMSKRLKINQTPKLSLTKDPDNANKPFGMTGYYNPEEQLIKIYITDRHKTDILRSFAHEVIHHWQNERGQLGNSLGEHYTQNDPHLRKKEMEAYLLGNILFRDWQDEQRYGAPENEPTIFALNENLIVTNPTKLTSIIKRMVQGLVADRIISSYHQKLTSGDMDASDYVEDFAGKISSALQSQIQMVNDRGNYASQGDMVK
jgi:hypothetical protein